MVQMVVAVVGVALQRCSAVQCSTSELWQALMKLARYAEALDHVAYLRQKLPEDSTPLIDSCIAARP